MESRPPDRRRLGRRTSDWLLPTLLWLVALSSLLAARHFWQRVNHLETMNEQLRQQVQLLERTPTPPPAPTPTPAKRK